MADLLGLDPSLIEALDAHSTDEPRVLAWLVVSCCIAVLSVAVVTGMALVVCCGMELVVGALGGLFAALCTLNLMRLVHASAGLSASLNEELLTLTVRPALVPTLLLVGLAGLMSQAACAALLGHGSSLAGVWQRHPALAALVTLLVVACIGAPALLRVAMPEGARTFEFKQRELIERRIAAQRDTCAEMCDALIAYELDRIDALKS